MECFTVDNPYGSPLALTAEEIRPANLTEAFALLRDVECELVASFTETVLRDHLARLASHAFVAEVTGKTRRLPLDAAPECPCAPAVCPTPRRGDRHARRRRNAPGARSWSRLDRARPRMGGSPGGSRDAQCCLGVQPAGAAVLRAPRLTTVRCTLRRTVSDVEPRRNTR